MLVEVVLKGVPSTADANHHMIAKNPDKNKGLRFSNSIFSFGDLNYGELCWTLTLCYQFSHHFIETFEVVGHLLWQRSNWHIVPEVIFLILLFLFFIIIIIMVNIFKIIFISVLDVGH